MSFIQKILAPSNQFHPQFQSKQQTQFFLSVSLYLFTLFCHNFCCIFLLFFFLLFLHKHTYALVKGAVVCRIFTAANGGNVVEVRNKLMRFLSRPQVVLVVGVIYI